MLEYQSSQMAHRRNSRSSVRDGLFNLLLAAIVCAFVGCRRNSDEEPTPQAPARAALIEPKAPSVAPPAADPQIVTPPLEKPEASPGLSKIPVYELRIQPKDLTAMERSAFSNQTVPGTFAFEGASYDGVQVRYRGAWARSWPKKPLKIFFDKAKLFEGQRCINLNSAWHDPAFVREFLAYHVYQICGCPAPRSRMVRLDVNGQFRGLYVQVEQPDKNFTKELQLKGATVYKANSRANQSDERDLGSEQMYRQHYEKQTKKSEDYADLQEFCRSLAQSKDPMEFFNQRVDVERYVNYLAATVLVQNWDGFNKNHYLIHDSAGTGKWIVVPWDLDRTFGDHWRWSFEEARLTPLLGTRQYPGVTGWNRLQEKFFSNPTLRARFSDRLLELLRTEFTEERLYPVLDQIEAAISPDAERDRQRWPGGDPDFHSGIEQVKRYIKERREYLLAEAKRLR